MDRRVWNQRRGADFDGARAVRRNSDSWAFAGNDSWNWFESGIWNRGACRADEAGADGCARRGATAAGVRRARSGGEG